MNIRAGKKALRAEEDTVIVIVRGTGRVRIGYVRREGGD